MNWRPDGKEVYTIFRGPICCRVQEKWAEIRKMAEENNINDLTTFVKNLRDFGCYRGVLHRNVFRSSSKIGIVGLGFWGPSPREKFSEFYDVQVVVEEHSKHRMIASFTFHKVQGFQGNIFHVYFEHPVVLEAGKFYNIGFQLEGPNTGICDPIKVQKEFIHYVNGQRVDFSFLRGSLQMPEIKYILI